MNKDRFLIASSLVILLVFTTAFMVMISAQDEKQMGKTDSRRAEAESLWELAITAKGGREKLNSIKNMVVVSRAKVRYAFLKTYENLVESLIVFPDKRWTWNDNRPSVFGLSVQMYDYEKGIKYHRVLESPDTGGNLVPFEATEQDQIGSKSVGLVIELMETYWLKPVPEQVREGKIRGNPVHIVQTTLDGKRIDFALDKITHLPVQVSHYYYQPIGKQNLVNISNLSDYVAVDGIMMPSTIRAEGESGKESRTYQFNVKYSEEIFRTAPPFDAGPEAWKKKTRQPNVPAATTKSEEPKRNAGTDEIRSLVKQIDDADSEVRGAALDKLVEIGQPAVPHLVEQLTHRKKTVVLWTAQTILQISPENPDALASLLKILKGSGDQVLRRTAAFGMASSPTGIRKLADLLADGDVFIRRSVVFAFDDLTERDLSAEELKALEYAEPALQKAVNDKDQTVSEMAEEVLGQLSRRRSETLR